MPKKRGPGILADGISRLTPTSTGPWRKDLRWKLNDLRHRTWRRPTKKLALSIQKRLDEQLLRLAGATVCVGLATATPDRGDRPPCDHFAARCPLHLPSVQRRPQPKLRLGPGFLRASSVELLQYPLPCPTPWCGLATFRTPCRSGPVPPALFKRATNAYTFLIRRHVNRLGGGNGPFLS
jgi:hypothetical protein